MRNGLMMKMRKVMKQFTKYICAFLMLVGINASAWGTSCDLKIWDKSTSAYITWKTIDESYTFNSETYPYYDDGGAYHTVICWTPSTYSGGYPSGDTYYYNQQYGTRGTPSNLYAVYQDGATYTSSPDFQVGFCTYTLTDPSGLSVDTRYESGGKTYVRFDWTPGDATHAVNQKFCYGAVGEAGTCVDDLSKSATYTGDLRSKLSNGEYWWSIQALGDNDEYCNSSVVEGGNFCIDDVETSTPDVIGASSLTTNSATISWSALSDAAGYMLTIKKKSDGSKVTGFDEKDIDGTSANVTGLSASTTYKVELYAYNSCADVSLTNTSYEFTTLTEYAITLDGNGGDDGIAGVYNNATALHEITAPTRDHYTLEGYYTTSECETKIANTAGELVASITVGVNNWTDGDGKWIRDDDETFYANWTPDNQTISFNANGGSGSMDNVVRAYNTTYNLPACGFTAPDGKVFDGWAQGSAEGTVHAVGYPHTVTGNITFYATWRAGSYTDAKFSCADWSLTGPSGDIVFITSAASKTVRSQEAFHVSGSGLPHSTALTFSILPVSSKFAILKADGTIPSTNKYGVVDADVYVFYTPDAEDTSDGLDEITSLTVSVTGEPRTATIDTKRVIGRHLPADFVIAGKKNNKWYALPADFSDEQTPDPVEIAVDDINNPSIAYTANTNIYNLYGQNSGVSGYLYNDGDSDGNPDGEKIKLGMKNNSNKPLFAFASPKNSLKGDGTATVTNNINKQYWWTLKQIGTSITNPQDAKYNLNSSNNSGTLSIKNSPFAWGTYASGVEELRLIPASNIPFTEGEIVEWGQHKAVVEVYPYSGGNYANTVDASINGVTKTGLAVTQTQTSVKNGATKYNYTVDFTSDIDFETLAGKTLLLDWKYNGTSIGACSMVVPRIIATSATMSSIESRDTYWTSQNGPSDDVHVLPNVVLTADAGSFGSSDVTIKNLEIYPGATVKVTTGTLDVTNLVMRNGWTRAGAKAYDVARLYVQAPVPAEDIVGANLTHTNAYSDWYIDYDQYYPIAVPFPVATSSITYKNSNSLASAGVRLRYYSGELRATNIQQNQDDNWVEYKWDGTPAMPANLEPSHGYIMTAKRPSGKAFSIVRMPLTFSNEWTTAGEQGSVTVEMVTTHKDQVTVTAWGNESTPTYAKGWNIIANPYMAIYNGTLSLTPEEGAATTVNVVNIPDVDFKEYDQVATVAAKLKPGSAFLIQAPATGVVTFGTANRKLSAPSYRREVSEAEPEQQAYIVLASDEAEDMMGIFVSEKYTAEYDLNGDVEKLLSNGNSLRTYMLFNDMKMAYLAINQELAEQLIPVNVRIATTGEHAFSMHSASKVSELEGVYLTDYLTGDVTNLLEDSYTFNAEAGTISGRFAINAKVGKRPVPTDLDIVDGDIHGNQPIKFLYNDKVFILHNGVIYDATGKKVRGK